MGPPDVQEVSSGVPHASKPRLRWSFVWAMKTCPKPVKPVLSAWFLGDSHSEPFININQRCSCWEIQLDPTLEMPFPYLHPHCWFVRSPCAGNNGQPWHNALPNVWYSLFVTPTRLPNQQPYNCDLDMPGRRDCKDTPNVRGEWLGHAWLDCCLSHCQRLWPVGCSRAHMIDSSWC